MVDVSELSNWLARSVRRDIMNHLNGESATVVSPVETDGEQALPVHAALVATPTRLVVAIDGQPISQWALPAVGLIDYDQPKLGGLSGGLSILVDGRSVQQFSVPFGKPAAPLGDIARFLTPTADPGLISVVKSLPWRSRKASWPGPLTGTVDGGNTRLAPGLNGYLRFGSSGVSFVTGGPKLKWHHPWERVTAVYAEGPEELKERPTVPRLLTLGLLAFAYKKAEGTSYVTVDTTTEVLYHAVEASAPQLRRQLATVTDHFTAAASVEATPIAGHADQQPGTVEQLTQLVDLHRTGGLTDEEFAAAKAAVLKTSSR